MSNSNNNESKNNLENQIMSQIKTGKVKLRSKYIFLAEKLGLNSGLVLSVILAILFFSLLFFYLRATDSLAYLSFGKYGIWAFLESFPYLLVICFIAFLLLAGFLITKTNWSYKKPFKYFAVGLLVFVLLIGGVVASTDVSEKLEEQAFNNYGPGKLFRPFLGPGISERNRGIAGRIYEIGNQYLILETPRGFEKINFSNPDCWRDFQIGQFIIATGKRDDHLFWVEQIQISIDNEFPPMIIRGIHRQFNPPNNDLPTNTMSFFKKMLNFDQETNFCLEECVGGVQHPKECFSQCVK